MSKLGETWDVPRLFLKISLLLDYFMIILGLPKSLSYDNFMIKLGEI